MITLQHYLAIGLILFVLGMIGFLTRRNVILMFLSAELMLQGVVINLLAFSRFHGNMHGQVFGMMIIAVAACEAGIAMALFLVLYRQKRSLDISLWQNYREDGLPESIDTEPVAPPEVEEPMPKLPVAGREPDRTKEKINV
ncbi:MAG: NADH-quinone oxidoreductase subunit NuoK [Zavarzinella sp.]